MNRVLRCVVVLLLFMAMRIRVGAKPRARTLAYPDHHFVRSAGAAKVATRCLTPDDVADLGKTFGPQASTVNSECERTEFKLEPQGLTWRLQCKGQVDMDVAGQFVFESPTRYSALIVTKATMLERIVQDTMVSISAERIGECR